MKNCMWVVCLLVTPQLAMACPTGADLEDGIVITVGKKAAPQTQLYAVWSMILFGTRNPLRFFLTLGTFIRMAVYSRCSPIVIAEQVRKRTVTTRFCRVWMKSCPARLSRCRPRGAIHRAKAMERAAELRGIRKSRNQNWRLHL